MKLSKIIEQVEFRTFVAMVKVIFKEDMGSAKIGELLRALSGVTTVTLVREERPGVEIFKIKLITQNPPSANTLQTSFISLPMERKNQERVQKLFLLMTYIFN